MTTKAMVVEHVTHISMEMFSLGNQASTADADVSTMESPAGAAPQARESILDYWQFNVHWEMFLYISPVLIIGGTLGNLLTLVVMQSQAFRSTPSSFILSALAVVDTGVLPLLLHLPAGPPVSLLSHAAHRGEGHLCVFALEVQTAVQQEAHDPCFGLCHSHGSGHQLAWIHHHEAPPPRLPSQPQ